MDKRLGIGTRATKAYSGDQEGAFIPPIYQSAVFNFPREGARTIHGHPLRYSREDNPTVSALEDVLRTIESDDEKAQALAFSSGMAAISSLFFSKLKPGSKLIVPSEVYSVTLALANRMKEYGVQVEKAKTKELPERVDKHTTLVFAEVMSNPTLNVVDVPELVKACRENDAALALDNTFTTPLNFRPLENGAQFSVSSATKFIAGHNDVVAGALIGFDLDDAWEWRRMLGGALDPHAAYLVIRGIKTLQARLEHEQASAMEIAERLEGHRGIARVLYPGLESHPTHVLAKGLLKGFGAVLSFEVEGGSKQALEFMKRLKVIQPAPSLGGTESTIMHPASAFSGAMNKKELEEAGISAGLLRLSVGLEDVGDLIWDIEQALASTARGLMPL